MPTVFTGFSSKNDFNFALSDAIAKAKIGLKTDFINWHLSYVKGQDGGFVLLHDLFVGIEATGPNGKGLSEIAYFQMQDASEAKQTFIVKIVDPEKIAHARKIISGTETSRIHLSGTIIKEQADYNSGWAFHIDPTTIDFFQVSIEVCDSTMQYIEDNLDDIGGATLPENHWCPWSSLLIKELKYEELEAKEDNIPKDNT